MIKRTVSVFAVFIALFSGMIFRVFQISRSISYASAANNQSSYLLELDKSRGKIYDCNFTSLVDNNTEFRAAISPCPEAATAVFGRTTKLQHEKIADEFSKNHPFVLDVDGNDIFSKGVDVFAIPKRYSENQLAPHVIGYIGANGDGITGIETAYNEYLTDAGGELSIRYTVDTMGRVLDGAPPEKVEDNYNSKKGVVLTIDKEIQSIAEQAATEHFEKGAVVVMDVRTGEIKAMVSLPDYDPNNVSEYLQDQNSPMINRAILPYNVGSTFKLLVAGTAIEHGLSEHKNYCNGYVKIGERNYNCHYRNGHGNLDMEGALKISCNPYFITLMDKVGGESVAYKASQIGFGSSLELAKGMVASGGRLPTFEELQSAGELANFSFGQGFLTATPLQIAQLIATIADGGAAVTPKLVAGYTIDGETISEAMPTFSPKQVLEPYAALEVQRMMIEVIENGSGKKAKPALLGAGGKTGSAQTGTYDEYGSEIVHAWFGGFYPADDPIYSIVVLSEGMDSGGDFAAPVFKKICDRIALLKKFD